MAEYCIMFHVIELNPGSLSGYEVEKQLGAASQAALKETFKALDSEEWQILSHALTKLEDHIVLSFILGR